MILCMKYLRTLESKCILLLGIAVAKNMAIHPPNSHDCMPNETFHSVFKNMLFKKYGELPEKRRTMQSLYNLIHRVQKEVTPRMVAPHIKKLPDVMQLIIEKKGGPTGK